MININILPVGWKNNADIGNVRYYYHNWNRNFDDDYVNVLDTRPIFGKQGASRRLFDDLMSECVGPDYVILNKSVWGLDDMNMLSLNSNTKVVYPIDDVSEIYGISSSYYIDCILIRRSRMWDMMDMINKLSNRKNCKPIWIDTTNMLACSADTFRSVSMDPMVTHCLSTLVANMTAQARIITESQDGDWSGDYVGMIESPESNIIYHYNEYVMENWTKGLKPLKFDEFLKGGK